MSAVLENTIEKEMTVEEFYNSPYSRGFELVKGRVVAKGGETETDIPAGALHGFVTNKLGKILSNFVDDNNLGAVFAAETGFKLAAHTVRGIDIAFVSRKKIEQFGIPEKFYPVAPDLAAEVVSPGNSYDEIQDKIEEYLAAGAELVWIVYPKRKTIMIYYPNRTGKLLGENDALEGENVIPNFRCDLSEIFGSPAGK